MNKYKGLVVLAALAGACAVAVEAAPGEPAGNHRNAGTGEAQIGQLGKRLAERVAEQQELLDLAERLLGIGQPKRGADGTGRGGVLSGQPRPAAPAPEPVKVERAPVATPAPWWQGYRPQMVYLSGNDRYAVVNGRMLLRGQTLEKDVVVEGIEDDAVVLRRGKELHTYFLKK